MRAALDVRVGQACIEEADWGTEADDGGVSISGPRERCAMGISPIAKFGFLVDERG